MKLIGLVLIAVGLAACSVDSQKATPQPFSYKDCMIFMNNKDFCVLQSDKSLSFSSRTKINTYLHCMGLVKDPEYCLKYLNF